MKKETGNLKGRSGSVKKRKTIKKPKYFYEFLKCGAICLVIALCISWFMLNKKLDSINDDFEDTYTSTRQEVTSVIAELILYEEDDPGYERCMNELEKTLYNFAAVSGGSARFEFWINGEKVFEPPLGPIAWIGYNDAGRDSDGRVNPNKTEYYFLDDASWLAPVLDKYPTSRSSTYPHDAFASYFLKNDESEESYYFMIERFMINRETHRFIPELVSVYSWGSGEDQNVATVNCCPQVPEGFERVPASNMTAGGMTGYIPEDRPDYELTHCSEWQHVGVTPYVEGAPAYCELRYSDYADFSLTALMPYETAVFMVGAVIIGILSGLLLAVIPYFKKRSIWEAYDYRKKTTEAMAHDLKTPLATISAYAESMEGADPELQTEYAGKICENVSEMNRMVENILNFSKSDHASRSLSKTEVDVGKLVNESVSKFEGLFGKNQIRTNVTGEGRCMLTTDEPLLRQAIENLVSNCAKYAEAGSEVEISVSEKKLFFRNRTAEKIEDIDALKKPFVKGEGARGESGTGLGLSIADNNLAILGYQLKLSSEDGWFTAQVLFL